MKFLFLTSAHLLSLLLPQNLWAQEPDQETPKCPAMQSWDYSMAMCRPVPMAGMPMQMLMLQGNSFFLQTIEEKPRGRDAFSIPDMLMIDLGSSVSDHHYLNVDFMGTAELWTFPRDGTPEFLQIGENQANGEPYLDAQHPHSSPIMGLTLSDTIAFSDDTTDHLRLSFAPRGESTDGPVAFMHRPTGLVNPDAPLGHHIGQDAGHISSTVLAASLHLAKSTLELSTFHGTEPVPTAVDLPMAALNSYAARFTQEWNAHWCTMLSAAFVQSPDPSEPSVAHIWRYSASVYGEGDAGPDWKFHNALIWGLVNFFDNASALDSFAEEFWLNQGPHNIWGRLEALQRTPFELQIADASKPNQGQWVTALTLGYTQKIKSWEATELGLGGSLTKDFMPGDFATNYSGDSWAGKIFLQLSGMKMWEL